MPVAAWSEPMLMGVAEIDTQHGALAALVEEIVATARAGDPARCAVALFVHLEEEYRAHMECEEHLMQIHGYPRLEAHRAEHARVAGAMAGLQCDLKSGRLALTPRVAAILVKWYNGHAEGLDRELADFLRHFRRR